MRRLRKLAKLSRGLEAAGPQAPACGSAAQNPATVRHSPRSRRLPPGTCCKYRGSTCRAPNRSRAAGDARVVDEDIDFFATSQDFLNHSLDRSSVGDIDSYGEALEFLGLQLLGHRARPVETLVCDGYLGACVREAVDDAFSDALGAAGNDRGLPGQVEKRHP